MDKSNLLYTIVVDCWLFIKKYAIRTDGTEREIAQYTEDMNRLSEKILSLCDDHAERKFARDLITACNNYYQNRYLEKNKKN